MHSPTQFQAHPWHGIRIHQNSPTTVLSFIEIVPSDTVKYEVDKASGHLMINRPQVYSNICPANYGFIPRSYCGKNVATLCEQATGRSGIIGDGDPLDICVLSEKLIPSGNFLLEAVPIGGFRMIDNGEADDKIIAVLKDDAVYGSWSDVTECPEALIARLKHYFLTYKNLPGSGREVCEIPQIYGKQDAFKVIEASYRDYIDLTSKPS